MLKKDHKAKYTGSAAAAAATPGLMETSSQSSCGSNEAVHEKKQSKSVYTTGTNNVQQATTPTTGGGVKASFVKKSLSSPKTSSQRYSRRAVAPVAVESLPLPETNEQETFLDLTIQDLQVAFNSLYVWVNGSTAGLSSNNNNNNDNVDDATADKQQQRASLDDMVLSPCRCRDLCTHDQEKEQQEDQFLFAEWKAQQHPGTKECKQQQEEKQNQQQQENRSLSWIISACAEETFHCQQKASDVVDHLMRLEQDGFINDNNTIGGDISIMDSEEADEMQMRRLTSWGTIGTDGSIVTCESSTSLATETERGASPCVDDDGNPINPVLLEKTIAASQKRRPKRKRLVKFEYPPVSSFRQCERIDQEDVDKLFFTEEELDQYEEDRYQTAVADDVEVVAIAPSLEGKQKALINSGAMATGTPKSDVNGNKKVSSPRLVKSVQIFLRERSTGNRTEE